MYNIVRGGPESDSKLESIKGLKALNEPMMGDGLVKSDNDSAFWLQALVPKGEKLEMNNLKQQAAMPLSAFLRFDPWTDKLIPMHTSFEPILSSADKMPFEVTPVYLKLAYYKPPVAPVDPGPAAGQAAPATVAPPADATPPPAAPAAATVPPPTQ